MEGEKKPAIFAVKTSIGQEKMVADMIVSRARRRGVELYSILFPINLKGYLLVEATDENELKKLIRGMVKVRGLVEGKSMMSEIEHFLTPKPPMEGIVVGDIVEITAGPFKGEKAKVQQIDRGKEEVTVELFDAVISIPLTVQGSNVRLIEKEEKK